MTKERWPETDVLPLSHAGQPGNGEAQTCYIAGMFIISRTFARGQHCLNVSDWLHRCWRLAWHCHWRLVGLWGETSADVVCVYAVTDCRPVLTVATISLSSSRSLRITVVGEMRSDSMSWDITVWCQQRRCQLTACRHYLMLLLLTAVSLILIRHHNQLPMQRNHTKNCISNPVPNPNLRRAFIKTHYKTLLIYLTLFLSLI